ncbi:MAG: hypothetical protein QM703_13705 [Gemmatales bacterium]
MMLPLIGLAIGILAPIVATLVNYPERRMNNLVTNAILLIALGVILCVKNKAISLVIAGCVLAFYAAYI